MATRVESGWAAAEHSSQFTIAADSADSRATGDHGALVHHTKSAYRSIRGARTSEVVFASYHEVRANIELLYSQRGISCPRISVFNRKGRALLHSIGRQWVHAQCDLRLYCRGVGYLISYSMIVNNRPSWKSLACYSR